MARPLTLSGDGPVSAPTLDDHLAGADPGLARIARTIAAAARPLAHRVARGALPGDPAAKVGNNDSGDAQKALDVGAHAYMLDALADAGIAQCLSEEATDPVTLDPRGAYDIAIDPIDGSGSIGIGALLGLFFVIYPAGETFLRPGREAVAAGYVSFGHSIDMGLSFGDGVAIATLDPEDDTWRVTNPKVTMPDTTNVVAFNAANLLHWDPALRRYIDDCLAGSEGPRGGDTNMRWIGAAVGDLHRILQRGGVFMYPADSRPAYQHGQLRLTYEAVPIAFLMDQAGGAATDGTRPILDLIPSEPHAKTPLIFGAASEVATISRYLSD